jgi:hypothetical protein
VCVGEHLEYRRRRIVRRTRARNGRSIAGLIIRSGAFLLFVVVCVAGVRWLGDTGRPLVEADRSAKLPSLSELSTLQPATIQPRNRRLVYPYSVVPGGVRSAGELQSAAAHDPVVAEHYKGFDYKRARLVEVSQPQLVYLSYRRGDRIYWTRKQASLRVGEKLLTDGRTTARTRCGNQVSVLPQAATSPEEPTMAELDRPDAVASGREELFPTNLNSDLLPLDPQMQLLASGNAFLGGPPPGGFMPVPIGGGSGPITLPTGNGCPPNKTNNSKNCQHTPPPPPPPVPEPETVVLMLSGTAAVIARYRYTK